MLGDKTHLVEFNEEQLIEMYRDLPREERQRISNHLTKSWKKNSKKNTNKDLRKTHLAKDTDEFFNLARYWDDVLYPWEPIAELSARAAIPDEETQELAYWLGNIPEGLDLVKAISADDYNSVAESRIKIYPRPQRMRRKK